MTNECYFCGNKMPGIEQAIEAGWMPSFWDGDGEVCYPTCPTCAAKFLHVGPDGELERKPEIAEQC